MAHDRLQEGLYAPTEPGGTPIRPKLLEALYAPIPPQPNIAA